MQAITNVGPIYHSRSSVQLARSRSYVLRLEPRTGTHLFGRNDFLMHGDSIEARGCASGGCIILPRAIRELVWQSGDTVLEVVAEFQTQDQDLPEAASA
jgi:hypothetical protein